MIIDIILITTYVAEKGGLMFSSKRYGIGLVAGSFVFLMAMGIAGAQATRDASTIRFKAGAYTIMRDNTARFLFFKDKVFKPIEVELLTVEKDSVFSFFDRRYNKFDANQRAFTAFKEEFGNGDARDLTFSTYITNFKTPNIFFLFSDNLWRDFGFAWKDAGFTWKETVTKEEIDTFFFNYFSTNTNWNLDTVYKEFKAKFGIDGDFTLAIFRDFFFIRGLLDYAAVTATNVTAAEPVKY